MHILGLQGMSRRIYTYRDGYGFDVWNMVATIGAFTIAVSMLVFFAQHRPLSRRRRQPAPARRGRPVGRPQPRVDASRRPPPSTTSTRIPIVTQLDDFWHRKYGEDENGKRGAHRRAPRTSCQGDAPRRPPAVAVVLAARARRRPAPHRLRPDLQPGAGRLGGAARAWPASTAGCWSRRRRRAPPHDHDDHDGHDDDGDGRAGPSEAAERRARRRRSLTDTAAARRGATLAHGEPRATGHAHHHRALQREAGDVGVPRLGVPALRRPDLHLPAATRTAPVRRARPRRTSTTSRSPRSARSCC